MTSAATGTYIVLELYKKKIVPLFNKHSLTSQNRENIYKNKSFLKIKRSNQPVSTHKSKLAQKL